MAINRLRINKKIPSLLDAATAGIQRPIVHTAGTEQVIDFYPIKWSNNYLQVFSCASVSYSTIQSLPANFPNLPSDEEQLIAKGIKIAHVQDIKKDYFWSYKYRFLSQDDSYPNIYIYEDLINDIFSITIKLGKIGGDETKLGSKSIELPSGIHYPDADSVSEIIFVNDPSGKVVVYANNSRYGNLGNIVTMDIMPINCEQVLSRSSSKGWIITMTLEALKTSGNFYYPH